MNSLPGLSQLAATPEILRMLLANLGEEQTQWKPAPERMSIAEILEHISHVEGHCFRDRIQVMLDEDCPAIEPYDQEALIAAGQYSGRNAEDSFDHFEEQREDNLDWLRSLSVKAAPEELTVVMARTGRHRQHGIITVGHLLNEWAFHDLGHIRQIAEIVRALLFWPEMGPLQSGYQIKP